MSYYQGRERSRSRERDIPGGGMPAPAMSNIPSFAPLVGMVSHVVLGMPIQDDTWSKVYWKESIWFSHWTYSTLTIFFVCFLREVRRKKRSIGNSLLGTHRQGLPNCCCSTFSMPHCDASNWYNPTKLSF